MKPAPRWDSSALDKIRDWSRVIDIQIDIQSYRLVLVNGVFDLLHPGHVKQLNEAADFGDVLVVSVDRDENVRLAKGRPPLFSWEERAFMVASLPCVDAVTWHTSQPCHRRPAGDCSLPTLIRYLRPAVWCTGNEPLPALELEAARDSGSVIQKLARHGPWSTSEIIRRLTP